jgi:restriction endonuclease
MVKGLDREKLVKWLEQEVKQYLERGQHDATLGGYCEEADYILRKINNGYFDKSEESK